MGTLDSGEVSKAAAVPLDISDRDDVHKLRRNAIGLGGVLFISFAAMSPLTGQLGNVPLAVGLGNGIGAPAGFWIGIVMLVLFSVGYVKMMRSVPSSGGFYSFISHGLGRPLGMGAGWLSIFAYAFVECSLYGAFGYFGNITIQQFFHVGVPWPILAFGALALNFALAHFDIRLSTKVLGVALILEIVVLTVMAVAVFAHGGGPTGVSVAPINPVNAFKGLAPGVGIFFAVWSWVGFETIPNYAEESRNPRRIGAQALFISVVGGGLFFGFIAWAVITGWGLNAAVGQAANNGGNFYYGVTTTFAAKWVTDVMEWLILTSSFACALSFHNTNSRYLYVIGREKIFNHRLGRTHQKWQSPHVANAATTVIVAALLGLFLVIWYASPSAQKFASFGNAPYYELFGWFAIVATFSVLVNQTLSSVATILHFRKPEYRHERNLWTTEVIPVLSIGAMGVVLWLLWSNLHS
ncbi:MAG TPA: APC family permease, partial [Acidimicrobiales bacterium]|nr:APC family permease [Acidimicrobiales bacterium]